ncbi:MAG: hypothetical protein PF447_09090 [Spirochaetaceae bacterium]|nr:hypothetical protein [Spirochaetaceae bacterium]
MDYGLESLNKLTSNLNFVMGDLVIIRVPLQVHRPDDYSRL